MREVFKKPTRIKNNEYRKANQTELRNIVKYIKVHYLEPQELDKALYGECDESENANGLKRATKRRALVWYVIGHWRTRGNGKKIFVRPYWKGALREIKKAIPERGREIIIPEQK